MRLKSDKKTKTMKPKKIRSFIMIRPGFHKANYDYDNDQFRVKTKRLA